MPLLAIVLSAACTINTGLDPACPVTAAGITGTQAALNESSTTRSDAIFASLALHGTQQLSFSLPLYEHLHIDGAGDAYGTGDAALGYTLAFDGRKRLTQFAGLFASFPTGANTFTAGRTQLAPEYGASYALGERISLVAFGSYQFGAGGTKLPYAPLTQTLTLTPRAIVDLSRRFGLYTAIDAQYGSVTGDERYQTYQADAFLGIARAHYNLAFTYRVPISAFTRENLLFHAFGAQLSWQR